MEILTIWIAGFIGWLLSIAWRIILRRRGLTNFQIGALLICAGALIVVWGPSLQLWMLPVLIGATFVAYYLTPEKATSK